MEAVKMSFIALSFILSLVAFGVTIGNMRRDKFKIQRDHIEGLIGWHFLCVQNMIRLQDIFKKAEAVNKDEVIKLVSELSALIDQGRFFFPNIEPTKKGPEKPLAYRGYRHGALSMLVLTHSIFDGDDPAKRLHHAEEFQREFTSIVYEVIKENKVTEKFHKTTGAFLIPEITYSGTLLELDLPTLKAVLRESRDKRYKLKDSTTQQAPEQKRDDPTQPISSL